MCHTWHFECELALAADFGDGDGLSLALDLLPLSVRALAAHLNGEGRAVHVVVGELEVDDVVAGLGRFVGDVEGAVFVVLALDLRFAWAFD